MKAKLVFLSLTAVGLWRIVKVFFLIIQCTTSERVSCVLGKNRWRNLISFFWRAYFMVTRNLSLQAFWFFLPTVVSHRRSGFCYSSGWASWNDLERCMLYSMLMCVSQNSRVCYFVGISSLFIVLVCTDRVRSSAENPSGFVCCCFPSIVEPLAEQPTHFPLPACPRKNVWVAFLTPEPFPLRSLHNHVLPHSVLCRHLVTCNLSFLLQGATLLSPLTGD